MPRVTTVHLSPDARTVDAALGPSELGEISREEFVAFLEQFSAVDAVRNLEADPHLSIVAPAGKFLVRTGRGKLFLHATGNTAQSPAELSAGEIAAFVERDALTTPALRNDEALPPIRPRPGRQRGVAAALLIGAVALNGFTLRTVFATKATGEDSAIAPLTDAQQLAARQHDVVGTFATGDKPGDRLIVVEPEGRVRFTEIGSKNALVNNSDSYRIGRRDKKTHLATTESGLIEIVDVDTLSYYGDTYRRVR